MISGSLNSGAGLAYARLKMSQRSRVSSRCCCWSSPTGTCVALPRSQTILAYLEYVFDLPISEDVCCLQNWIREEPRIQQRVLDFRLVIGVPRNGQPRLQWNSGRRSQSWQSDVLSKWSSASTSQAASCNSESIPVLCGFEPVGGVSGERENQGRLNGVFTSS